MLCEEPSPRLAGRWTQTGKSTDPAVPETLLICIPLVKGTEEPLFSEREIPLIFPRNEVMIFPYGNSTGSTIKGMNRSPWGGF